MPVSYRNQSIDLQSKSVDLFLYDNSLHHERVKEKPCQTKTFDIVFNRACGIYRTIIWLV